MIAYRIGVKNRKGQAEGLTGVVYETGKEYEFIGPLKLWERGFHCVADIADLHLMWNLNDDNIVIWEVEVPDDAKIIEATDSTAFVTNKMRVLRVLSKKEAEKVSKGKLVFDEDGTLVFARCSGGCEFKREKRADGSVVEIEKEGDGSWTRSVYDMEGRLVCYETSDGYREERQYSKDRLVYKNPDVKYEIVIK